MDKSLQDPATSIPIFLGAMTNAFLGGIVIYQCCHYYMVSKGDPRWLKQYIAFVFLLDLTDTIICVTVFYLFLTTTDPSISLGQFSKISFYATTYPTLTSIIACTVQLFFVYRIHRLRRYHRLTFALAFLSILQCLVGITTGAVFSTGKKLELEWTFTAWLALSALADAFIAMTVVHYLKENETGYDMTDDLIAKITRAIVQTGVILTVWAIAHFLCFIILPTNVHMFLGQTSAKLYTISLFSLLNARSGWSAIHKDKRDHPTLPSMLVTACKEGQSPGDRLQAKEPVTKSDQNLPKAN
jgi:hypothetical protein